MPNLQLTDLTTDIISENIDLAIRIGNLRVSRLVARKLCNNPVVMVASPRFLQRHGEPGSMKVVLPRVRLQDYQSIYLVYASRKHLSPALSEFLAHLQLWVQRHPVPDISDLSENVET